MSGISALIEQITDAIRAAASDKTSNTGRNESSCRITVQPVPGVRVDVEIDLPVFQEAAGQRFEALAVLRGTRQTSAATGVAFAEVSWMGREAQRRHLDIPPDQDAMCGDLMPQKLAEMCANGRSATRTLEESANDLPAITKEASLSVANRFVHKTASALATIVLAVDDSCRDERDWLAHTAWGARNALLRDSPTHDWSSFVDLAELADRLHPLWKHLANRGSVDDSTTIELCRGLGVERTSLPSALLRCTAKKPTDRAKTERPKALAIRHAAILQGREGTPATLLNQYQHGRYFREAVQAVSLWRGEVT